MRTLVGYGDTEGTPHNPSNDSELWNMYIVFKHVIHDDDDVQQIFHVTHLSINKNADKKQIRPALSTHYSCIQNLKDFYNCDDVRVGFWGASHDIAVLNSYDVKHDIQALDLLAVVRNSNVDDGPYNIGRMCVKHNIVDVDAHIHTALGDVLRMVKLLEKLGVDVCNFLVTKHKAKTIRQNENKDVEASTSRYTPRPTSKATDVAKLARSFANLGSVERRRHSDGGVELRHGG